MSEFPLPAEKCADCDVDIDDSTCCHENQGVGCAVPERDSGNPSGYRMGNGKPMPLSEAEMNALYERYLVNLAGRLMAGEQHCSTPDEVEDAIALLRRNGIVYEEPQGNLIGGEHEF